MAGLKTVVSPDQLKDWASVQDLCAQIVASANLLKSKNLPDGDRALRDYTFENMMGLDNVSGLEVPMDGFRDSFKVAPLFQDESFPGPADSIDQTQADAAAVKEHNDIAAKARAEVLGAEKAWALRAAGSCQALKR